jgi:hypothetical protein
MRLLDVCQPIVYPICTHSLTISEIQEISQRPNYKNINHLAFLNNIKNARKATFNQVVVGSSPTRVTLQQPSLQ